MQELFAGIGLAIAVALVFAVTVANSSITSSASNVVRAVIGPADLQLHARGPDGFDEHVLANVEHLPGVKHVAPFLEQTATVTGPKSRQITLTIAGASLRLALMDGLSHTLPGGALSEGIGLSEASASALGITSPSDVTVDLRGRAIPLKVSAILGHETAGALSIAKVAIMPLSRLQELANLPHRVSRILVQSQPGHEASVRAELDALAGGNLTVVTANQDVSLLREALRPSDQASELFAGLSALLGFLFAFNAMLLTVPDRREAIADLRLDGTPRTAIVQMVIFEALCLALAACLIGLLGGYILSIGLFHQSPGYLTKAFTLGTNTIVGARPVLLSLGCGIFATCLASIVPLKDLRRGRPVDAVFTEDELASGVSMGAQRWLASATVGLIGLASGLLVLVPDEAIMACVALALATMLAVPLVLGLVLRAAQALATSRQNFTVLPLALASLRTTSTRSLALAATGAVALFGSVALGSSRDDLLRGIDRYTTHYVNSANVWVVNPDDNQAISSFPASGEAARVAHLAGVASVHVFQGSFLDFGNRRVWVIAWPPSTHFELLRDQIIHGGQASAVTNLRKGNSITVSDQIATEHHVKVGAMLPIPTPTGMVTLRIAATTTNFGWSPGAILMSTRDYARAWASTAPSALGVEIDPGASATAVREAITRALGPSSGLEVLTANAREAAIDTSASEGLGQLEWIAVLLVAAAILAMAAALGSSIWQQRESLAELRLEGAPRSQLQLVLFVESALMLSAGCLTGAVVGIYGQVVIDGYLKHVTGFPVASIATSQRPIEIFALVIVAVLLIASLPGWFASRVPATLALNE
jgi:putative ABC transport system permease protein